MNSSYCLNMSLCNNHENNDTKISFYNTLFNACHCAKGTCVKIISKGKLGKLEKKQLNLNLANTLTILTGRTCLKSAPALLEMGDSG